MKLMTVVALLIAMTAVPVAAAQARTETSIVVLDYTGITHSECTGEDIAVEGSIRYRFHNTWDASGGFHGSGGAQEASTRGVGTTSGASYIFHLVVNQAQNYQSFDGGPYEYTEVASYNVIKLGEGPADDLVAHSTFHVTVNANGEQSVAFEKFRLECQ